MHAVPGLFDRLVRIYGEGELAANEGRFADAIALFDEGIALDDQFRQRYVTMYAHRGFAKQRIGDHVGAIADIGRAIELEPVIHQAQYHFRRAMSHLALTGHDEHALADFDRSIELYPDHPGPFHLRGKLFVDLGRFEEAIADFDRFDRLTAPHPEVLQLRGYAKLELRRGRDAIGDLLEANRLRPDTYTEYLLAWAGAIAPDDELFYRSMQAVLRADPSYRPYFVDNDDYRRFYDDPRFRSIVGD